jgi:hypothetical protein
MKLIRLGHIVVLAMAAVVLAYPGYPPGYEQSYFPPSPPQQQQQYGYPQQQSYDPRDDRESERFRERFDAPQEERFQQVDDQPPGAPDQDPAPAGDTRPCAKTEDGCVEAELHSDLSMLNTDEAGAKLQGQLEDTEADIVSRKRSIKNELAWITQVEQILKNYATKIEKVKSHIETEKKALTDLKIKKKKIKNLIKKKQLEEELRSTTEDLTELQNELKQVQDREAEFDKSKDDLKTKIQQIEGEISSLKGDEGGGESSTGAAEGGDDDSDESASGEASGDDAPPADDAPADADG